MELHNFADEPSLVSQYMAELRDVAVQKDRLRFRRNLERIGEIMAYEISRRMAYRAAEVPTPLGTAHAMVLAQQPVLATIFRAGVPFHQGFLNFFDNAENAFVSAYRKEKEKGVTPEVCVEYLAAPSLQGKTLVLVDPMLATGMSMELSYRALLTHGTPRCVHIASVIASRRAVDYLLEHFPAREAILWTGDVDAQLNEHSYIVPGLGDAGDLAYGTKL